MTIDNKIRIEKLENSINREAAKISELSTVKIDKREYLTGEEILSFNENQRVERNKFTYFHPGRALEKFDLTNLQNR